MVLKQFYQRFSFQLCYKTYNFSWHDDWNWSMISIHNYEWIQTRTIKKTHIGGIFLIYIQKKKSFYLTVLGLKASKNLFYRAMEKLWIRSSTELKDLKKKDNQVTTITLTFSMNEYEKIKKVNRTNTTTQDLLHLMNEFVKKHNLKNEVTIHFIDDQLQKMRQTLVEYSYFIFM